MVLVKYSKLIVMKLLKRAYLILGLLFTIAFIYSLFEQRVSHELFLWDVNIWNYRIYRFALALLFIGLYFKERDADSKNQ